jgi:hypothetical protein
MKRIAVFCGILSLATVAYAGFKAKTVKPKKPEQFQARTVSAGITFAADLLVQGREQKGFFCDELTGSNIVALRLAVFNAGDVAVTLPLETLRLIGPDGKELPPVLPETVARAVLSGATVPAEAGPADSRVLVVPDARTVDPRYDPTLDPNRPHIDPTDPRSGPGGVDPADPRYDPSRPAGGQSYPGRPYGRPGVDVVLNPGSGGDLSQYERALAVKDFSDKAHTLEPVLPSLSRDRFLYFSCPSLPANSRGYVLRLPATSGMPQEIILKF